MEAERAVKRFRQRAEQVQRQLERLQREAGSILDAVAGGNTTAAQARRLVRVSAAQERLVQAYAEDMRGFAAGISQFEELKREAKVTQKRSTPARDEAKIAKLSEQLTSELRLERVDDAMKELLGFLEDEAFFATNATTGRKRRLRALQNAIAKALDK